MAALLNKIFRLSENNTSVRTEVTAGLTTFLTMAYIIFVNPAILATDFLGNPTGLDHQAVLLATCVAAAAGTFIMGVYARYPIAQAPGMGNNYLFVTIVMSLAALGITNPWQTGLGIVFLSGVGFLILSLLKVRQAIIESVSPSLRNGIAAGIGLFIAFIGLRNGSVLIAAPGTFVGLNVDFMTADIAVFTFGLLVISALMARKVRGAIVIGILLSTALAWALGQVHWGGTFIGLPRIENAAMFQLDIRTAFSLVCLPFVIILLFTDVFNTIGTLVGVAERGGFMRGNVLPRANQALVSDAGATIIGSLFGTSTVTSYIESAAGIEQGGRTGLTAVVVAILFILALFFAPLAAMVGGYAPITASALVVVGTLMCTSILMIDWNDYTESLPAFLIMLGIPLTNSITDGLALGFISYPVVKLLAGRPREANLMMYLLGVVMLAYLLLIRVQIV
ncbi:NCS2 family permease [Desulfonatronospira sp.]|uniref:NCS2 family permease n=1 Tax=Desulfonatronospira sp. TaxID=1962951 RepID=UPI0025BE235F|nr:NCS2 family permease [Desulfonatronospira sp.]